MLGPIGLLFLLLTASASSSYAPSPAICPSTDLVRPASDISAQEKAYRTARKLEADKALRSWLGKTNAGFGTSQLPTVALTTSGGGYRSLLVGAGVIQGLDARDSNVSTSGLYQALTYQAGLSGGSWLLSSFAGNNYPTISYLKANLWEQAFQDSLLDPGFLLVADAYFDIVNDVTAKDLAGFQTTLVDPYARLLSYQLLQGFDGGVDKTMSSIATLSNFTSYTVPFPIITALGARTWLGECGAKPNGTQYEFSPYEFGSWDTELSAFTQTQYLGTSLKNGKPTGLLCTQNYDNLGYILGTSSNIFSSLCADVPPPANSTDNLDTTLAQILDYAHEVTFQDEYAIYRNPFYQYVSSTSTPNPSYNLSAQPTLNLVDGGSANQNNPLWPFLQPARSVDVIIVNDNSADTTDHFPSGISMVTTYEQALAAGLTRMPYIPPVSTFLAEGLNKRATFFGCNDTSRITMVYLPNNNFTYASNTATAQVVYQKNDTDGIIANGVVVASQDGREDWGTCLGCAVMLKTGESLPTECAGCLEEYCFGGAPS